MTEMLSMLMIFYSFFFTMLALKKKQTVFIVFAGLFTGLLILSKQVGLIVISYYILLFLWFSIKKNKTDTKILLYIIIISVLVISPFLLIACNNDINLFRMVPAFRQKSELVSKTISTFQRYESGLKEFIYLFYTGNGIITIIFILIAFLLFFA